VFAADGQVEINAASATAGGITPSDLPGLPVTIDTPGSYVLTSDLVVPSADISAIVTTGPSLSTNLLTIDLNGFQIVGPVVCGGPDTSCSPTGTGDGIRVGPGGAWTLTVRNGYIVGIGNLGISSNSRVEIFDVTISSNGGGGVVLNGGKVANSTITTNGGDGIRSHGPFHVTDSVISYNRLVGVWCRNCTVSRNTIIGNRTDGIEIDFDSATIIGNTLDGNHGFGINASAQSVGYGMNSIDPSIYGGGTVSGSAIQIGTNICDGNTTCP
jgi:hypothetical protein